jgi:hypothetical protein
MARLRSVALASCAAFVACFIAGCPGGGDGGGGGSAPPQFSVSPTSLSFSAAGPNAATPSPQAVTATINGINASTLFVRIDITGTAVVAVDNIVITGPNTGQMTVHGASPIALGSGTHTGTLTVTACTTDINCSGPQLTGSPATVTYQVGAIPPLPNAVAPSVGTVGVPGEIIIRGNGFDLGTSVTFDGGIAPTFLTVMSASEIRAGYPALSPAGQHTVSVTGNTAPFDASLHLVDPGTLVSATLSFPSPPQNMRGLAYDARREALIVGAGFSNPATNEVLRYTFSGGSWSAAPQSTATVGNLRGFTLSLDGERLLAITDNSLVELNPATLAVQATTARTTNLSTDPGSFLKSIVATNDGQALPVAGGPNFNQRWLYDVAARTFSVPFSGQFAPAIGGPDNGSRVVLVEGGLSPAQPALQYSASSGLVSTTSLVLAHHHPVAGRLEAINPPVFDRSGSLMLVAGFGPDVFHAVYDANFSELGRVPSSGAGWNTAVYALSPDGTLAFTLEIGTGVCRMRAFGLGTPAGAGVLFPQFGPEIDLSPCPASRFDTPIRMIFNPPGDTLFIAGDLSISVFRLF